MPLVHGFCRLPCIFGRAYLACHQVHYVRGFTSKIVSDEAGEPRECTCELFRAEHACPASIAMSMFKAAIRGEITAVCVPEMSA